MAVVAVVAVVAAVVGGTMIDLEKALKKGGPGLLLIVWLILFGAVIGVAAMIAWSNIKLEPDMANFLGGVLGAALGAGLAVLGAVYIQQREWVDSRVAPANRIVAVLTRLRAQLFRLVYMIDYHYDSEYQPIIDSMTEQIREQCGAVSSIQEGMPEFSEFPAPIYDKLLHDMEDLSWFLKRCISYVDGKRPPSREDLVPDGRKLLAEFDDSVAALAMFRSLRHEKGETYNGVSSFAREMDRRRRRSKSS